MASIFITGDTHFGHEEAIPRFHRPFGSIDAMDAAMIDRINERVDRRDALIHVGDFFGPMDWEQKSVRRRAEEVRGSIRCRKITLVRGNHDPQGVRAFDRLFQEIHDLLDFRMRGTGRERIVLSHYPLRIWRGLFKGALHAYGHAHGTMAESGRSTDVGVDCWQFHPIELESLAALLRARPIDPPTDWSRRQPTRSPHASAASTGSAEAGADRPSWRSRE